MSGGLEPLALKEDDVQKFLACSTHLGATNIDFQMEQYVYKRKTDGTGIINLRKTWEKVLLAARAIAAIENPADVCVISARPYGQRAVLKFAHYTGATPVAGRFTPGTFTNQIQAAYREPRLLVVTDPRTDHQPVTEASYVNIPVIALCNTDSPLKYVDICIPCNNKSIYSIGLMWWMLTREVMRLRGTISREVAWDVMVDLFFYRDPEEAEKEAAEAQAAADKDKAPKDEFADQTPYLAPQAEVADWATESVPVAPVPIAPAAGFGEAPAAKDWGATESGDWSTPLAPAPAPAAAAPAAAAGAPAPAAAPAPANEWGGSGAENWG